VGDFILRESFFKFIQSRFSEIPNSAESLVTENLIANTKLTLPKSILSDAQLVIKNLFSLRENPQYQKDVLQTSPLVDPLNKSICMSYDFHIDTDGVLKLIEVNTNAAFLAMGLLLYEYHNTPLPIADFSFDEISKNIHDELSLWSKKQPHLTSKNSIHCAIVDENPPAQRLFIEFLVFQSILNRHNIKTNIVDTDQLEIKDSKVYFNDSEINFIYNRNTDFYFENIKSQKLNQIFKNNLACISPNPFEYALLADKGRLLDWTQFLQQNKYSELESIHKHLLTAEILTIENRDDLWKKRKKLFIKPLQGFGSKQAYRGESISHGLYDSLADKGFLAQEFCAPPEHITQIDETDIKLKYDLRFYAYQARLQMAVARLYEGQVTGLRSPHGGFACIEFV
jgi:glutathionylspermidine synthase